ncbi:alanine racemase [Bacteriovoracaceae bacterium]|nr:alanine racemase [Bacteriovoracaceae bacterium]
MTTNDNSLPTRNGIINLPNLGFNLDLLKKKAPNNEIIFMVKSNAYGHGELPIVKFANLEKGINFFGFASLREANFARKRLPFLEAEFIVFSDLFMVQKNMDWSLYAENRIIPVVHNISQLESLLNFNENNNASIPLYLMFNTGMNRLGFDTEEKDLGQILKLFNQRGITKIHHLMSHFGYSYSVKERNTSVTNQYTIFGKIKKFFQSHAVKINHTSMANSGAIEQGVALEETHIRPGLILYGPSSMLQKEARSSWNSKMVSTISCKILSKRTVKKGERCSYGLSQLPEDGILLVINLGYADGVPLSISNHPFELNGERGQFFGRVNMDMTFLFFPQVEDVNFCQEGDVINLWDENPESFYRFIGKDIHPYAVLCSMQMPRLQLEYLT